jgi:hypothetical protein
MYISTLRAGSRPSLPAARLVGRVLRDISAGAARLTKVSLKKVEKHSAALAMHLMHYNFACIHRALRATPATAAEVTANDWDIGEIVDLTHTRYLVVGQFEP